MGLGGAITGALKGATGLGGGGSLLDTVATETGKVFVEKEETKRARIEAELRREKNQLDAQSKAIERAATANGLKGLWRPWLMIALTVICVLHSLQTALMVGVAFFGDVLTSDQADLLGRWIAYVMFVFGVLGAFGGVTSWSRGKEKIAGTAQSPVDEKRDTLQRMRAEPPASPVVREAMPEELPEITKRMDGVVVPTLKKREPLDFSRLRDEIIAEEGVEERTYLDTLGYLTGGVGHKILPGDPGHGKPPGFKLTKQQIGRWLVDDIDTAIAAAKRVVPDFDSHPQEVRISLVSMAFQLGEAGLAKFRNMLAALARRDYVEAARQARDSLAYEQTTARWERHAARFENFA